MMDAARDVLINVAADGRPVPSARFMGGLTPAVWVILTLYCGLTWRQNLWVFAGVALLWCLVFALWFRNTPAEHPSVNDLQRYRVRVYDLKAHKLVPKPVVDRSEAAKPVKPVEVAAAPAAPVVVEPVGFFAKLKAYFFGVPEPVAPAPVVAEPVKPAAPASS